MKNSKKLLSLFLAVVMLLSMFSVVASAYTVGPEVSGDINYKYTVEKVDTVPETEAGSEEYSADNIYAVNIWMQSNSAVNSMTTPVHFNKAHFSPIMLVAEGTTFPYGAGFGVDDYYENMGEGVLYAYAEGDYLLNTGMYKADGSKATTKALAKCIGLGNSNSEGVTITAELVSPDHPLYNRWGAGLPENTGVMYVNLDVQGVSKTAYLNTIEGITQDTGWNKMFTVYFETITDEDVTGDKFGVFTDDCFTVDGATDEYAGYFAGATLSIIGNPNKNVVENAVIGGGVVEPDCTHENTTSADSNVVNATCKEAGSKTVTVTCDDCGEVISVTDNVVIAKLPHTIEYAEAQTPTCVDKGWAEYEYCTVCDYTTYKELDPTGVHAPAAPVRENVKDATCGVAGSYDEVVYCEECDAELSRDVAKEIPATGAHTPAAPVRENVKDATCGVAGSYDEVVYCEVCSEELSRDVAKEIPATGAHTPAAPVQENVKDATYGAAGSYDEVVYCSVCGDELSREVGKEIPMKTLVAGLKGQIRFQKNADGSYADKFDIRAIATISNEAFNDVFGSEEEAAAMIKKVGFVFAAGSQVDGAPTLEMAKARVEKGEYSDVLAHKSVSYISTDLVDDGYAFTCLVTGIEDYNDSLYAIGYIAYEVDGNIQYAYYPAVQEVSFADLYNTYYPQAFPNA